MGCTGGRTCVCGVYPWCQSVRARRNEYVWCVRVGAFVVSVHVCARGRVRACVVCMRVGVSVVSVHVCGVWENTYVCGVCACGCVHGVRVCSVRGVSIRENTYVCGV